jgi:predicted RNase H-like nuclease (RuvC/YqgF family)
MRIIYILTVLLLIGCNSNNTETLQIEKYNEQIDSIINQSQENITHASGASRKSDSTITGKIEKTVKKIQKLETEIKELKAENNELKNKLDNLDDAGNTYHIRAISDN